jgi:hypothetical protein
MPKIRSEQAQLGAFAEVDGGEGEFQRNESQPATGSDTVAVQRDEGQHPADGRARLLADARR